MPIQLKTKLKEGDIRPLARADFDRAVDDIPPYPGGFKGRGITICGGGHTYFTNAWILIRMLRKLGCGLPIQLWYYGADELDEEMAELVSPYGVECVDAKAIAKRYKRKISPGWPLKPLSILYSPFEEVLALDCLLYTSPSPRDS